MEFCGFSFPCVDLFPYLDCFSGFSLSHQAIYIVVVVMSNVTPDSLIAQFIAPLHAVEPFRDRAWLAELGYGGGGGCL